MEKRLYSQLTGEVLACQRYGHDQKTVIEKIAAIVYSYPQKARRWDADEAGDFFCTFYPKIPGIIARFRYTGSPFETYLKSCIRWQMKTFMRKRAIEHATTDALNRECRSWSSGFQPPASDAAVFESAYEYSPATANALKIEKDGCVHDPAYARRIIYLVLRNANMVDDSLIKHAAKLTGYDETRLLGYVTELRRLTGTRKERIDKLNLRRNGYHIRIQRLRLTIEKEDDPERKRRYQEELIHIEGKLQRISEEIASIPSLPTHRDIAEVVGVPKGSVDSGLHYLRMSFRRAELN